MIKRRKRNTREKKIYEFPYPALEIIKKKDIQEKRKYLWNLSDIQNENIYQFNMPYHLEMIKSTSMREHV